MENSTSRGLHVLETLESRIAPATLIVTNLHDSGAGSLRQALIDANASANNDTVVFKSSLHGTITLSSGELDITDDVVIKGGGRITVSGDDLSRVFDIDDGDNLTNLNVTLSGLKIVHGNGGSGGGVLSREDLTIKHCVFSENVASGSGGGIHESIGSLKISNSKFTDNHAGSSGGGFELENTVGTTPNQLTLTNSKFTGNFAGSQGGGFESNVHAVVVSGCIISGNTAASGGGAYIDDDESTTGDALIVTNCKVTGNHSTANGGGLYIDTGWETITVSNSTFTKNTAGADGAGLLVYGEDDTVTTIAKCTILDNSAVRNGAGIFLQTGLVTVKSSVLKGNQAIGADSTGGGIFNDSEFAVSVINSVIVNNYATDSGGGIFTDSALQPTLIGNIIKNNSAASQPDVGD